MLSFVPPERCELPRSRLKKPLWVPFGFSTRGSEVVVYEPGEAYDKSLTMERRDVCGGHSTIRGARLQGKPVRSVEGVIGEVLLAR